MAEAASTCPKCGQPRPPAAVECPFCGVIYARFRGRPEPEAPRSEAARPAAAPPTAVAQVPSPPPPPGELDEVYQGPSIEEVIAARAQPSAPGGARHAGGPVRRPGDRAAEPVVETETVFTRNLGPSILIAAVLLLLLQALVQAKVLGGGGNRDEANQALFSLAGIDAPEELDKAVLMNLVGHRIVLFSERQPAVGSPPTLLLLYHRGWLAGSGSRAALAASARDKLDLIQLPWHRIGNRSLTLNRQPAIAEVLGLGSEENPSGWVVSSAFEASDGRPALLVLVGAPRAAESMLRAFQ